MKQNEGILERWYGSHGFIRCERRLVFVHLEGYLGGFTPELGQVVAFEFGLSKTPNRPPQAIKVRVLKSEATARAERKVQAGLLALQKSGGAQ